MKLDKTRRVIRLGRADTRKWEDSGPDGHAFRSKIRKIAEDAATAANKSVEIYASESKGGYIADQVGPREDYSRTLEEQDREWERNQLAPGTRRA